MRQSGVSLGLMAITSACNGVTIHSNIQLRQDPA